MVAGQTAWSSSRMERRPAPLLSISEKVQAPATSAGPGLLAFVIQESGKQEIGIATLASGRLARRIPFDKGTIQAIDRLAGRENALLCGGPHGVECACLWRAARPNAERRQVTIDPDGRFLVVFVSELTKVRLFQVPLNGGVERRFSRKATRLPWRRFRTGRSAAMTGCS